MSENPLLETWKKRVVTEKRKIMRKKKATKAEEISSLWKKNRDELSATLMEESKPRPLSCQLERLPANSLGMSNKLAKITVPGKNPVVDKVNIVQLPEVVPLPNRSVWAAIRSCILEEDQNNHINVPYFGDEVIEKDKMFIESIVEEVNASNDDCSWEDDVLSELITALQKYDNDDDTASNDAFALLTEPRTAAELEYNADNTGHKKRPSIRILQAISATYPDMGSTRALIEKLRNLTTSPQDSSHLIPNIDAGTARAMESDETLHSYKSMFCRRCMMFYCQKHEDETCIDEPISKPNNRIFDLPLPEEPCGPDCYMELEESENILSPRTPHSSKMKHLKKKKKLYDPELVDQVMATPEWNSFKSDKWTPAEISLFRVLIKNSPANFCYVAQCMMTKKCYQVFRYSILEGKTGRIKKNNKVSKQKKKTHQQHLYKSSTGGLRENKRSYFPCYHPGKSCSVEDCSCIQNNNFCEKFCYCPPDCRDRFPGCSCKSSCRTKACSCYLASRECDPDLCTKCLDGELELKPETNSCRNILLQRSMGKKLYEAPSDIAGWGCFLGEKAEKNEFIAEYVGELISQEECERRGRVYDKAKSSYMFNLTDNYSVDAARFGGKIRFANHSSKPNCQVRIVMANGDSRIGIYAKQDIEVGDELFFDYGKDFVGHDLI